jgi:hypothetical protein
MVLHNLDFAASMANPDLLANFHKYLKNSYCPEPLEFMLAVSEKYLKEEKREKKIQIAQEIRDRFLLDGSRSEINIDGYTKKNLLQSIEDLCAGNKLSNRKSRSFNAPLSVSAALSDTGSILQSTVTVNDGIDTIFEDAYRYEFISKLTI